MAVSCLAVFARGHLRCSLPQKELSNSVLRSSGCSYVEVIEGWSGVAGNFFICIDFVVAVDSFAIIDFTSFPLVLPKFLLLRFRNTESVFSCRYLEV